MVNTSLLGGWQPWMLYDVAARMARWPAREIWCGNSAGGWALIADTAVSAAAQLITGLTGHGSTAGSQGSNHSTTTSHFPRDGVVGFLCRVTIQSWS